MCDCRLSFTYFSLLIPELDRSWASYKSHVKIIDTSNYEKDDKLQSEEDIFLVEIFHINIIYEVYETTKWSSHHLVLLLAFLLTNYPYKTVNSTTVCSNINNQLYAQQLTVPKRMINQIYTLTMRLIMNYITGYCWKIIILSFRFYKG